VGATLNLLVLKTRQMDPLLTFYQALGIEFVQEQNGKGPVHYAARVGPTVFDVYPLVEGSADSTTRLGFAVDDLEKVLAALQSKEMPRDTPWGRCAAVRDPDGRSLELCQQVGHDGV